MSTYILPLDRPMWMHDGFYTAIERNLLELLVDAALHAADPMVEEESLGIAFDALMESPGDLNEKQKEYEDVIDLYRLMLGLYRGLVGFFDDLFRDGYYVHAVSVNLARKCCIVSLVKATG